MIIRPNTNVAASAYGKNKSKIWNGASWVEAMPKIWDGGGWVNEVGIKSNFNITHDYTTSSFTSMYIMKNGTITDKFDNTITKWIDGTTTNKFNLNNYVIDVYEDPSTSSAPWYFSPTGWYGFQNLNNDPYFYSGNLSFTAFSTGFYWCGNINNTKNISNSWTIQTYISPQSISYTEIKKIQLKIYEKNKNFVVTSPLNATTNWPYGNLISSTDVTLIAESFNGLRPS